MRIIILALVVGPLLHGCLEATDSIASGGGGNNAGGTPGNSAPTIAGNPAWGTKIDEMYEFRPSATDPDGDTLTFDVQNKPDWANFDSLTGRLSGRPTMAQLGDYASIIISVSDGNSKASLQAFSITVSQTALGVITLNWVAPSENTDGSPLMDLAGYKIYVSKNNGYHERVIRIDNSGISTYVVEQLSPATYYFAATAFNSSGIESSFSGEIVRTIQ